MQGRLRDLEGDRAGRVRRGVRCQTARHRPRICTQDPQQVGNAQEGRDGLLPGGEGRPRLGGQEMDHKPALRLPGRDESGEFRN